MNSRLGIFVAAIGLAALAVWGCAVQGGGNIDPVATAALSVIGSKAKVLDFDAKTYIDAAAACNAQAAKDYNAAQVICLNPSALVAQINNTPAGAFVTAQVATSATQILTAKCAIDGFGPSIAATIQQASCPAAPSPSAAH